MRQGGMITGCRKDTKEGQLGQKGGIKGIGESIGEQGPEGRGRRAEGRKGIGRSREKRVRDGAKWNMRRWGLELIGRGQTPKAARVVGDESRGSARRWGHELPRARANGLRCRGCS